MRRSQEAQTAIRALLLTGELTVGDPLQEVTLAERLGVSRTPVREALHRLEVDGIVERSGRGYVVADLDAPARRDLDEVRSMLEPQAAALAATAVAAGRVAPVDVRRLADAADALDRAGADADASAAASANHDFHTLLGELSQNRLLCDLVVGLNDRLVIAARSRLASADWARAASAQHRAIADAIAAGDGDAAAAAATAHLDRMGTDGV